MTGPGGARWWIVGATKLPAAQRTLSGPLFRAAPDHFYNMLGAAGPDDDPEHPVGARVTYAAWLTEAKAAEFRAASNALFVEPDQVLPLITPAVGLCTDDPFPAPARGGR